MIDNRIHLETNLTTAQYRKQVRNLTKLANKILMDNNEMNNKNANYFLKDFHESRRGGVTSNIRTESLTKAQAKVLSKQLANFINADIESVSYKTYEKQYRSEQVKKMIDTWNWNNKEFYGSINDNDIREYFAIKEQFPELFDEDENFYQSVLKQSHKNARKKKAPSLMQSFIDAKKELESSGDSYTSNDLKSLAMKKAQGK